MGQKVNPHGARVGVIFDWSTRWYAGKKDFANNLVEDHKLREMLKEKYYATGISHIDIERTAQTITLGIFGLVWWHKICNRIGNLGPSRGTIRSSWPTNK